MNWISGQFYVPVSITCFFFLNSCLGLAKCEGYLTGSDIIKFHYTINSDHNQNQYLSFYIIINIEFTHTCYINHINLHSCVITYKDIMTESMM